MLIGEPKTKAFKRGKCILFIQLWRTVCRFNISSKYILSKNYIYESYFKKINNGMKSDLKMLIYHKYFIYFINSLKLLMYFVYLHFKSILISFTYNLFNKMIIFSKLLYCYYLYSNHRWQYNLSKIIITLYLIIIT